MSTPGNNINAILTLAAEGVDTLRFELDQDISQGYSNTIEAPSGAELSTHPRGYQWRGGKFKPIGIGLLLTCGVQSKIVTADDLVKAVENIFKLALSADRLAYGKPIRLSVGSWFAWTGFIQDLNVTWKDPFDIRTGKPMRADVRFDFLIDFFPGEKQAKAEKLPSRSNFNFAFKA